jgi:hypothetical protein
MRSVANQDRLIRDQVRAWELLYYMCDAGTRTLTPVTGVRFVFTSGDYFFGSSMMNSVPSFSFDSTRIVPLCSCTMMS